MKGIILKDLSELIIPDDLLFSDDHEWAKVTGEVVRIGITDYSQDQLGDIVYVELPEVGERFEINMSFGTVESYKSVNEILMPISGEVVAINSELENNPNLINESPCEKGWMIDVKPDSMSEVEQLMDSDSYFSLLKRE